MGLSPGHFRDCLFIAGQDEVHRPIQTNRLRRHVAVNPQGRNVKDTPPQKWWVRFLVALRLRTVKLLCSRSRDREPGWLHVLEGVWVLYSLHVLTIGLPR